MLLVTVDQFRFDYLTRFAHEHDSGLARLRRDGASFINAHLEHYPTVRAPGHATLASGATPATSGIIGNDRFDRDAGKTVTSVSDEQVKQVGGTAATSASPHRLLVTTTADELKLTRGRGAKEIPRTIGISLKDRSAILPVGRSADGAFWHDSGTGEFVTSTYYTDTLPQVRVRSRDPEGALRCPCRCCSLGRALSLLGSRSDFFPHGSHIRPIRRSTVDRTSPWNRLMSQSVAWLAKPESNSHPTDAGICWVYVVNSVSD